MVLHQRLSSNEPLSSDNTTSEIGEEKGEKPTFVHNPKRIGVHCLRYYNFLDIPEIDDGSHFPFTLLEDNDYEVLKCRCNLWRRMMILATPTIEGGVNLLFLFAKLDIVDGELEFLCEGDEQRDCMTGDFIPLKDIVGHLDQLGPDIILCVIGEGSTEGEDLSGLATERVAVLLGTSVPDEDEKPDSNCVMEIVLDKLKKHDDPRVALEALNDDDDGVCRADIHADWRQRRDAESSRVQPVEPPAYIPTAQEFRRLLEYFRWSNPEYSPEEETKWTQIDANTKKNHLMEIYRTSWKSTDYDMKLLILTLLSSVLNCIGTYWEDKDLAEFEREMLEAANSEDSVDFIEEIATILAHVAGLRFAALCNTSRARCQSNPLGVSGSQLFRIARGLTGLLHRDDNKVVSFINAATQSDNRASKLIALHAAAEEVCLGHYDFWNTMIGDQSVRPEAILKWTECVIEDYLHCRHEEFGLMNSEIIDCGIQIHKLCEENLSMAEGAPLWGFVQLALHSPLTLVYAEAEEVIQNFIKAAWKQTDKKILNDLVKAIYFFALDGAKEKRSADEVAETFTPEILGEIVKILTEHPKINTNMKRRLLSIFKLLPPKSIDFGSETSPVKMLMAEIESGLDHSAIRSIAIGALKNIEKRFDCEDVKRLRQRIAKERKRDEAPETSHDEKIEDDGEPMRKKIRLAAE